MFNFIKKQVKLKKNRKALIKAIFNWNIATETSYDEFRAFLTETKDMCNLLGCMEDLKEVVASIPKDTRKQLDKHVEQVIVNFYKNVTEQTQKATALIKTNKLKKQTLLVIKEIMDTVHSTTDTIEAMGVHLRDLMQEKGKANGKIEK